MTKSVEFTSTSVAQLPILLTNGFSNLNLNIDALSFTSQCCWVAYLKPQAIALR